MPTASRPALASSNGKCDTRGISAPSGTTPILPWGCGPEPALGGSRAVSISEIPTGNPECTTDANRYQGEGTSQWRQVHGDENERQNAEHRDSQQKL
jgi:hypothetical protein